MANTTVKLKDIKMLGTVGEDAATVLFDSLPATHGFGAGRMDQISLDLHDGEGFMGKKVVEVIDVIANVTEVTREGVPFQGHLQIHQLSSFGDRSSVRASIRSEGWSGTTHMKIRGIAICRVA